MTTTDLGSQPRLTQMKALPIRTSSQPGPLPSYISKTKGAAFHYEERHFWNVVETKVGVSGRRSRKRWKQQLPSTRVLMCGSCRSPRNTNLRLREYRTHVEANMRLRAASRASCARSIVSPPPGHKHRATPPPPPLLTCSFLTNLAEKEQTGDENLAPEKWRVHGVGGEIARLETEAAPL